VAVPHSSKTICVVFVQRPENDAQIFVTHCFYDGRFLGFQLFANPPFRFKVGISVLYNRRRKKRGDKSNGNTLAFAYKKTSILIIEEHFCQIISPLSTFQVSWHPTCLRATAPVGPEKQESTPIPLHPQPKTPRGCRSRVKGCNISCSHNERLNSKHCEESPT